MIWFVLAFLAWVLGHPFWGMFFLGGGIAEEVLCVDSLLLAILTVLMFSTGHPFLFMLFLGAFVSNFIDVNGEDD